MSWRDSRGRIIAACEGHDGDRSLISIGWARPCEHSLVKSKARGGVGAVADTVPVKSIFTDFVFLQRLSKLIVNEGK